MNNLDKQYTELLQDILDNGVEKRDRTGTGTLSVFGRQIRHDMSEGFPLLTTKKMHFKSVVTELLWFLKGDTNIKYLVDNGCHIWDGDAYKSFVNKTKNKYGNDFTVLTKEQFIESIKSDSDFAKEHGDLGSIYGKQWRRWRKAIINPETGYQDFTYVDQIANSINLLKTDPDSRRNRVNAWNVGELDQMVLPPCHTDFQFYTRELSEKEGIKKQNLIVKFKGNDCKIVSYHNANHELLILETPEGERIIYENQLDEPIDYSKFPTRAISLMWNQRSVDTFLGLPFNIASYGLLLEIIAKEVNMVPDELIGNLGDVHLYSNHTEQAKEQIGRDYTEEEKQEIYFKKYPENEPSNKFISDDIFKKILDGPKRTREPFPLPTLNIFEPEIGKKISILDNLHIWSPNCFIIENYQSHPTIKAPLSN